MWNTNIFKVPEAAQEGVPAKRVPSKKREPPSVKGTSSHALKFKKK